MRVPLGFVGRLARPGRRAASLAVFAAVLAWGCVDRQIVGVTVDTVTVDQQTAVLQEGDTLRFRATVSDVEGRVLRRASVEWETETPDLVTIGPDGLVEAIAAGTATVRATFKDVSGSATFTVLAAPKLAVEPDSVLILGEAGADEPVPDTLVVRNSGDGNLAGLAIEIVYPAGSPEGWLVPELSSTEVPALLVVGAQTDGLAVGRYEATVRLSSPDDRTGPLEIPVVLVLTGFTVVESNGTSQVSEAGTSDSVSVVLDAPPDSLVVLGLSVDLPTEVRLSTDSLTFGPDDWNVPQVVVLTGENDIVRDGDRTAIVTISVDDARSDDGFDPIADRTFEVTNADDDDGSFTIGVSDGETRVDEGGSTDDVTVVLDAQPLDTVVFRVSVSDSTEVAASPAILTFAPEIWDTPQTVAIQGVDDDVLDGPQSSFLRVVVDSIRSDSAFIALGVDSVSVTTDDDDAAGFSVTETPATPPSAPTTVSEAGTTDTLLVVLGAEPASAVVFSVVSDDPGEAIVAPASLTFDVASWDTPQVVVVTGVDDTALDGDQTSTVTVSVVPASSDDDFDGLAPATVAVTTVDDDVPGLTIVETNGGTSTDEAGTQPDQFTVALSAQPAGPVAIDLASDDLTEVVVAPLRLTFPAADWDDPQTVTVTGVDERFDDGDRAVPVVLTIDTAATDADYDLLGPDTVVVTNVDDDVAGFTLTETGGGSLVTESGSSDTVSVVLDARPIDDVVITLLSSDTTEFTVGPGLLTFDTDSWDAPQEIVVTGVDDGEPDGNRFSLLAVGVSGALSDAAFADVADQTVQVTTINDDTVSILVEPTAGLQTDEDGGTATFTVVLGSRPLADVVIDVASSEPLEGTVAPAALTFTGANWDQPQIVTVTGVDDVVDDGNRPYTILTTVSAGDTGYGALDPPDVAVLNIDNDAAPTLSIDDVSVSEGDAGSVDAVFTVTQSIASTQDVSVDWATADLTALAGTDYTSASGTLTFTAGGPLTQTVAVSVGGDLLDEGASEAFEVLLSNPTASTLLDSIGTGTIVDDDGAPALSIDDVAVLEGNAGTVNAVFTVTQSAPSALSTSVAWNTVDGTATVGGGDYIGGSGVLSFAPGGALTQTVTVVVGGDLLDEGVSEQFLVQLTSPTNATLLDATGAGTITDDDDPPTFTINDVTVVEGDGGTADATFTVTQSEPSGLETRVSYASADGSATGGPDYTATSGELVFAPGGPLTRSVTVLVVGDLLDEGAAENFTLQLSAPVNATLADASGSATITDDDDPPTLSIADVVIDEGDAGTVDAVFTVTRSAASGLPVTVDFATADGSATAGDDFTASSGTVTFPAGPGGTLTQTLSVPVLGDLLDEGDTESFTVQLTNPGNATLSDAIATGTITDDDGAPSLTISDVTIAEGDGTGVNAIVTVTLTAQSGLTVTVDYATADGTAEAGTDYTAVSGTLSFLPGNPLAQTIAVPVLGDVLDEGLSESLTVGLTNATNALIADASGTVTLTDDDGAPVLAIDDVTVTEGDAGTVDAVFTVTQSAISGLDVTVDYATSDGTATAGDDYQGASGSLTFPAGGSLTRTVTVTVTGDDIDEGTGENFLVTLSGATNAGISDPSGTGTITDDDDPPAISIADATVTEGDAGTVDATFAVSLSRGSSQSVTVAWATADGSAAAGSDYVSGGDTLTFLPGEPLTQNVTIAVNGDLLDEGASETFSVVLSAPTNGTLGDTTALGTITDDDDPPTVSIDDVTLTEGNLGTVNALFTVRISAPSAQTVTVDYATLDGTATTGDGDYDATSGTLTFASGGSLTQSIPVTVNGDAVDEGTAESFSVVLSAPTNATLGDATGVGTIIDDDGTPTLFLDDVTVTEGDSGTVDAVFTVTKSANSASTITVDYATAEVTADSVTDYIPVDSVLTFPPGPAASQTVTVTVNGDVIDEGVAETFTLNLSNPVNATILEPSEVGTITDDDQTSVSIADATVVEGNTGTVDASFAVTLSTPRSVPVSVDYATQDGTATAGTDYTSTSGTLTFQPGQALTQLITVQVAADLVDEGASEAFTVLLSGVVDAVLSDPTAVGTITDDDDVPTLSIDSATVTEGDTGTVNAVFTVSLSAPSSQTVGVDWSTSDGTASSGSDYTATSGSLAFTPGGSLSQTVTVTVSADVLDEGANETFLVSLSSASNATILNGSGLGTITDDDDPPTLSIDDVTVTEGDAGTVSAVFTVTQSEPSGLTVGVDYATANGTAEAGTDYVSTTGTLTFAPGSSLTRTIAVVVSGDVLDEGVSESFTLQLTNGTNATLLDATGAGTITDDDAPPTVSIGDAAVTEGDTGTVTAVFTVSQSAPSGLTVSVDFATQDGSATTADGDYDATTGTLTFLPGGSLTQTVSVTVNGDVVDEGSSEAFSVLLSGATNASLGDTTGVGTITDDDSQPTLSIDDVNVGEGDTATVNATFTVTLTGTSSQTVTVNYATADGTATSATDYGATSGLLTFLPGGAATQTVTVVVDGDVLDEGTSEAFVLNLSGAVNALIADPSGVGTITDDDDAPTLSIGDVTVTEGDVGTVNAQFTVTQSVVSGLDVSVDWATADGTAAAGTDYVGASGTLTFAAGGPLTQSVSVVVSGDVIDEGASEAFSVGLTNAQNASIVDPTGAGTITDDDDATLSIADVTLQEGNAGTVDAVFTVTKSVPSSAAVAVDYTTVDGSATAGDDYVAASGTLTFLPGGSLSQDITVAVNGDLLEEGAAETFEVRLSGAVNVTLVDTVALGTIVDDEGLPTLFVDDVTVVEGDTGTVDAVFTVTQSTASVTQVTVDYATADGTATAGSDYTAASGTLTFSPGDPLTQTVVVTVSGDVLDEGASESFTLELTNPTAAAIFDSTGVGSITDDDDATLSIDDVVVTEGDSATVDAVFTVSLSVASTDTVTVDWATANGTAQAGSDFAADSGSLTFVPGGSLTSAVTVAVSGDLLDEGASETFSVELTGAVNAAIMDGSGLGTITDDDDQPSLSVNDVSVTEGDSGGVNATFTVSLSAATSQTVSVEYATGDGTASSGSDFVTTSGTLQFTPGGSLSQVVSVVVNGDLLDEGSSEAFSFTLSNPVNAALADAVGAGTILDDDDAPTLAIADVTVTEGNAGTVAAVFTVTQSAASGLPVAVDYATANQTATAGSDYTAATGTLTFAPGGSLTRTVTVLVSGDLLDEGTAETFTVGLSNATNASITDGTGLGSITDDDGVPSLAISSVTLAEGDTGTVNAVFTVTQSVASGLTVSVGYSTQDSSASSGPDYTASAGTLTFAPGGSLSQTIAVQVKGDVLDEGSAEIFTVELASATNASISVASGVGTIIDDDDAPTLVIGDATVTEGNTGTVNAAFPVTLSAESGLSVSVSYSTADGTAEAGSDFVAASGTLTFNPGDTLTQLVPITVNGDALDEGVSEAFTVVLSGAVNAAITDASGDGTITDDDGPPSLSINDVTVTEGDADSTTAVFTVTQSAASALTTRIDWATSDGTASTADNDYRAGFGTVVFTPGGSLTQTISVVVNGDLRDEGTSEAFEVLLSNPSNVTIADSAGVGTITDDDDPPTVSISDVTVAEGDTGTVNAVFDVTIDEGSGLSGSVGWATADGSATVAGGDYQAASGTVNFLPGGPLTRQIVVTVNGDVVDEGTLETFTVALSSPVNLIIGDTIGDGTIVDDEGAPTLRAEDVSVTEGDTASVDAVFTVTLSAPSAQSITVDFATADGTATAGTDYTANSGQLTFAPGGALSQTVAVAVLGDTTDEGASETFSFELSNAVNATIIDASETGTIVDDDEATFSVDDVTVTEGDTAVFTVTQSVPSDRFVRVSYATADGTASAGTDYQSRSGTLTFLPGDSLSQTVSVPVESDLLDEGVSESFTLGLSGAVNATIGDADGIGTITDDDGPPSVSIADVTVTEGNAGTVNAVFTVTQSAASGLTTSVAVTTADGTATAGADYTAVSDTLTFLPGGSLSQNFTVTVAGDLLDEGTSEAFDVLLSDASNVTIADSAGVGTITDDDDPPSVSIADVTVTEGNAGTVNAVFTVTQSAASGLTTSVVAATADGTATAGADYTAVSDTLTFLPGGSLSQTVTVIVTGDLLDEGTSEAFDVLLSDASNVTIADSAGVGTITDDDDPPSVSIADVTVTEGNAGTVNAVFTVTQSAASGLTTSVVAATADGTATAGADYTAVSDTLTFLPGGSLSQTVTVPVAGDLLDEGTSEAFDVLLSDASNVTIADSAGVGTITDDDDPPTISINDVAVTEGDTGTVNAVFTVTQSAASGLTTSVAVATADRTATAGADYTAVSDTLTFFPGGSLSQNFTVTVAGDLLDEGTSEAFDVLLSDASNVTIADSAGVGTITDDDTAGITITPTAGLTTDEAGGTAQFVVTLDSEPLADVTIALASSDSTEGVPSMASAVLTSANWQSGVTVTVTGVDDVFADGDIGFTILTGAAVSTDTLYSGLDPDDPALVNGDDEVPGFDVTEAGGVTVTNEDGLSQTVGVVLTERPETDVVITVTSTDGGELLVGSAPGAIQIQLTFTTDNWNSTQNVNVFGVPDGVVDGDQSIDITFSVNAALSDDGFDGLPVQTVTATVLDTDP